MSALPYPQAAPGCVQSPRPLCCHCHRRVAARGHYGGLCRACHSDPAIRRPSKYGRRGIAHRDNRQGPLPLPTMARPGTKAKVAVLAQRAAAGQRLWHHDDAGFDLE